MNTEQSIFVISFLCLVAGIGLASCSTNVTGVTDTTDDTVNEVYNWIYNLTPSEYRLPLNIIWALYKSKITNILRYLIKDENPPEGLIINVEDEIEKAVCKDSVIVCTVVRDVYDVLKKPVATFLDDVVNKKEFFSLKLSPKWVNFFKQLRDGL